MTEAIEVTTFKLKGHSCEEFVAANADIDAWLKRQPGSNPAASPSATTAPSSTC